MTPPEHLFIGFSIGNIAYAIQAFFTGRRVRYLSLMIIAGVFANLPDIDSLFGHYGSTNIFIGHRGITHSLLSVSLTAALSTVIFIAGRRFFRRDGQHNRSAVTLLFLTILISGISHLIADLPQPPGPWGGIPLFFPSSANGVYERSGGWSFVGWYDYTIQWHYIYCFLISLPLVTILILRKGSHRHLVTLIIASMIIGINLYSHFWTIRHISGSHYVSEIHWNKVQNEYLEKSDFVVRSVSENGKRIILYILRWMH